MNNVELFTRNDICLYSDLTLRQLERLVKKEVIKPQKNPIRFTFNQLVYCGIFSLYRIYFDWEDSVKYLESCIKKLETGKKSDVITIYPNYGVIHTGYSKHDELCEIINNGRLSEILINQKVNNLLLKPQEKIINNIVEYYYDEVYVDKVYVFYLVNLIISFKNKAIKNGTEKFNNKLDINLQYDKALSNKYNINSLTA